MQFFTVCVRKYSCSVSTYCSAFHGDLISSDVQTVAVLEGCFYAEWVTAAQGILDGLKGYTVLDEPPTRGKDVNEQLQLQLGLMKKKEEWER